MLEGVEVQFCEGLQEESKVEVGCSSELGTLRSV